MLKRVARAVASVIGLLLIGVFVLFFAAVITSEGGAGCGLETGRAISASAHICVGIESTKDTATVRTLLHTIVVAPTNVTVDGKLLGEIAAGVKDVKVRVGWTRVEVLADGEAVGGEQEIAAKTGRIAR